MASPPPTPAADTDTARRGPFGRLADGTEIDVVELSGATGLRARILTLGAILQALEVPDRDGRVADVVLGCSTPQAYLDAGSYFGASVGRFANRIAGGAFTLDGRAFQITRNDGPNALHGGAEGFDKRIWAITRLEGGPYPSVTFAMTSPDGDQGFPGALRVEATYTLSGPTQLEIVYTATTDAPTIVNLTNHSYFNLGGEASGRDVMDHRLTIHARAYTPVDAGLIPTGELRPVDGTAFDFRSAAPVGAHIRDGDEPQLIAGRGYDHNFVLDGPSGAQRPVVRVEDPVSGRVMEVLSAAPGLQVYSGNVLEGTLVGKGGRIYRQGDALCLEPQTFPNAPNQSDFPSARLDPGRTYVNRIVYSFSVASR